MAPATILKLRLVEATFLKNVLEVLSDLFGKAHFKFSSTGLELQAKGTSGFPFVVLELRAKAFDLHFCDRDHLSMGLNLAAMAKFFSFANNDDIMTFKSQDGVKTVTITLESPKGGVIKYLDLDFVGLNGVPFKIPEYPEPKYQAIVSMPSALFMHCCNQLSSFCDTGDRETVVRILVDEDCVNFFSFTDRGHGSSTIVCPQGKEATHIEMKEKVSLTFGLSVRVQDRRDGLHQILHDASREGR